MYEHNDRTRLPERGAIDIDDFVFAATGARVRRLTTPDGEHWFPAVDVATRLGYVNTRQALLHHVPRDGHQSLEDLARSVYSGDALRRIAGHGLKKSMRMVSLRSLITLVNACTKPECAPFKAWVSEVIVTIQRDGTYSLDPAPLQTAPGTSYVMPAQVADAIVRLEERNLRADEALAAAQAEHLAELRRANDERSKVSEQLGALTHQVTGVHHVLTRIADALDQIADRMRPAPPPEPRRAPLTPQHLLATWRDRNLVVTEDVHAVAAHLAPALVHGPVACRLEDVAARTGLTRDRVHDCVRMLIKRGCVRQSGSAADGVPVYSLP
ncbi:DNA-binding protein [Streptomyces griseoluteus]|uniref:DNA-binding protein n=1 Tax=Streptomyces griseoluteus TaxID=29306 RepID=A0A4Z1DJ14_STRGP|nr:Bro-N domain-containing protein [Streptomyces griseoluteus]TGN83631.1 DNA-binding protein [Streptomyces griseoluteus]GHF03892.1 DNA-binding protein [Streptomyces griseoluteus]